MKRHLIILLLSLITVISYSQVAIPPSSSNSVANINAAIQSAVPTTGTDTYLGTYSGLTNQDKKAYTVLFDNANTTAATLKLNGTGPDVPIKKFSGGTLVDLVAGDISDDEAKRVRYFTSCTCLVIEGGSGSGGASDWGDLGGTLSDQTDLQAALDAKQDDITFGTGVQTALGVNVGSAGSPVVNGGALGTPSSGTGTNITGVVGANVTNTPAGNIAATTSQAAINELDTEKQGNITFGAGVQSALASSSGASSVVLRDANQNITVNNSLLGYTTTATAAGTTTLTVSSTRNQYFTGTTTQTLVLPVTSTLVLGQEYNIVNNSTGIVTVQSSGTNTIQAMAANSILTVRCILTSGTGTASWSSVYSSSNPMTSWGSILYGGDPGSSGVAPPTKLDPGTVGYVLSTNGSGAAPSWIPQSGFSGLTSTRIPVATSSTTIADYNGLKYDDASRTMTLGYSSSGNNILTLGISGNGFNLNTSTGEMRIGVSSTNFMTLYSNNAERIRIPTTGNVLIGTTTDNSKLTVNGSFAAAYVAKTANYTLDATNFLVNCTSNSFTITLPTAVSIAGRIYIIKNTGSGTITLATTSAQTIDGSSPGSLAAGPTQISVMSDGANWITF